MVLVVNLNASIDKRYEMKNIEKGNVMRARSVDNTPGGKGIHVANVVNILGEECLATGFLGGKNGEFIEDKLNEYGIKHDFVKISNETRECLAIITDDLVQTEILEPGPEVKEDELDNFIDKYKKLLDDADIVVASGSVPRNVPNDFYRIIIELANERKKKFLLDTSGVLLQEGIKGKPFFIKPNKDEIETLTGRKINTINDVVFEIKEFNKAGIELVAISLGGEGSVVGYKNEFYKVTFPKVDVVNPVGSGDSYVAGIATALVRGYDIEDILKIASACGTANAIESETGYVQKESVNKLAKDVKVEKINI